MLLHGGGGTLLDWEHLAGMFRQAHRVVAMDLRGHGQTTVADGWSFEGVCRDVDAVAAALALDRPYVVGDSLGGLVAVCYGAAHPDAAGVVNIDGRPLTSDGRPIAPLLANEVRERLLRLLAARELPAGRDEGPRAWMEAEVEKVRLERGEPDERWREVEPYVRRTYVQVGADRYLHRPSAHEWRLIWAAIERLEQEAALHAVRCPLLMVHCTRIGGGVPQEWERLLPDIGEAWTRLFERLQRARPNASVVRVPYGHFVIADAPEEIARVLLDWMASVA